MNAIVSFFRNYVAWLTIPEFTITDILEIIIIAYAFYHIILWINCCIIYTIIKPLSDSAHLSTDTFSGYVVCPAKIVVKS